MMRETKELPDGITPKWIHDTRRAEAILDALERFSEAKMAVPVDWIKELKDLFSIYWA